MSLWGLLSGTAAAVWLLIALLPWQPHRTRERLSAARQSVDLSDVTVLIPARNEAAHIGATIESLTHQGSNLHAIVIDDRSEDTTASVVRSLQQDGTAASALFVELMSGEALPAGWGGKLWALEQGLRHIRRPYTLLLDADIVLARNTIPALLLAAQRSSAPLVSVMATLRCKTFWERLLVPPFVYFFKLLYPFALVARPQSRVAAAAGGCILVETKVLREVGAFSSWSDALIDDCTLARRVKDDARYAGRPIGLFMSHDVRSTRAYSQLAEFWQMVTRTAYTQLRYSALLLLLVTIVMAVVFVAPVVSLLVAQDSAVALSAAAALVLMIADYGPVARFYRLPVIFLLTLPAAAIMFLAMTWHSAINYYAGTRATWKSRHYDSNA